MSTIVFIGKAFKGVNCRPKVVQKRRNFQVGFISFNLSYLEIMWFCAIYGCMRCGPGSQLPGECNNVVMTIIHEWNLVLSGFYSLSVDNLASILLSWSCLVHPHHHNLQSARWLFCLWLDDWSSLLPIQCFGLPVMRLDVSPFHIHFLYIIYFLTPSLNRSRGLPWFRWSIFTCE